MSKNLNAWCVVLRYKDNGQFFTHLTYTKHDVLLKQDIESVMRHYADQEGRSDIPVQVISWQRIDEIE